jgi:hypothetical protein
MLKKMNACIKDCCMLMRQIFLDFNPNKALLIRAHYSEVSSDLSTTQATTLISAGLGLG